MTSRGDLTRERILDAAERLYGDRGVEAVSLREIRVAAGQRNTSALQFHFGDRKGLLLALAQRHLPRIDAIQRMLYDEAAGAGRLHDPASMVEVMIRPTAEYIRRGPGARAWLEDLGRTDIPTRNTAVGCDRPRACARTGGRRIRARDAPRLAGPGARVGADHLGHHRMPAPLRRSRRGEDSLADGVHGQNIPFESWSANLIDMAVGALFAPVRAVR